MAEILRGGPGRTAVPARHPWPEDCMLQGGPRGVVLSKDGDYTTAFVEAFPRDPDVFIRGEGPTIEDAEDAAWARYEKLLSCPAHPAHGPWDRRTHRNGYAWCERCGTGFGPSTTNLPELPPEPGQPLSELEQLLAGDPTAIVTKMAAALDVPGSGDTFTDALAVAHTLNERKDSADGNS